jgi:O-antigen ligase
MSTLSVSPPARRGRAEDIPWVFFLLLSAIFFLAYHDFANAQAGIDNHIASPDEIIQGAGEASPVHRIALLSLGAGAIVSLFRDRSNRSFRVNPPVGWLFLFFFGWATLSCFWSVDPAAALKSLMGVGILGIAAVAIVVGLPMRQLILWTCTATAIFLCIDLAAEIAYGTFLPFASGYRFTGTLHPHGQGVDCTVLMLSSVAAMDLKKRWRPVLWILASLGFVFLVLSGSRTALGAALLALGIYVALTSSPKTKLVMAYGSGVLLCCLTLFLGSGLVAGAKSAVLLGREDSDSLGTFTGRTGIWEDVGGFIADRPMLGYGYASFWTPNRITDISAQEHQGVPNSHCTYIDYLLTLGSVGLAAYSLLLLTGIWYAFKFHRQTRNPVFAYCGVLLLFCVLDGFLESEMITGGLLLFLCLTALARVSFLPPSPMLSASRSLRSLGHAVNRQSPATRTA